LFTAVLVDYELSTAVFGLLRVVYCCFWFITSCLLLFLVYYELFIAVLVDYELFTAVLVDNELFTAVLVDYELFTAVFSLLRVGYCCFRFFC